MKRRGKWGTFIYLPTALMLRSLGRAAAECLSAALDSIKTSGNGRGVGRHEFLSRPSVSLVVGLGSA